MVGYGILPYLYYIAARMAKKVSTIPKKSPIKRFFRCVKQLLLFMFISSLCYVVLGKWVMPPVTITQINNWVTYGLERDYVAYDAISNSAKLAAIASEDQVFPEHTGFDWDAIEKSLRPKKQSKKKKLPLGAAASTITQQTAKNIFLWQGNGIMRYVRKLPEAYFTLLIELIWGKKRILEVYLNTIEMGPGIFGIEAAAQHYFQKSAKDLTKAQAAMIISCLPNPKKFTVVPLSKRVSWRYPQVLREMQHLQDDEAIIALMQ